MYAPYYWLMISNPDASHSSGPFWGAEVTRLLYVLLNHGIDDVRGISRLADWELRGVHVRGYGKKSRQIIEYVLEYVEDNSVPSSMPIRALFDDIWPRKGAIAVRNEEIVRRRMIGESRASIASSMSISESVVASACAASARYSDFIRDRHVAMVAKQIRASKKG